MDLSQQKSRLQNKKEYIKQLRKAFKQFIGKYDSPSKNNSKQSNKISFQSYQINQMIKGYQYKQEVLFMQFPMQKRGRNFGINELRVFRIQYQKQDPKNNQQYLQQYAHIDYTYKSKLYQIGGKQDQKQLPLPTTLIKQYFDEDRYNKQNKWNEKIMMEFDNRSPIWVYFSKLEQCNQILAYISTLINKKKGNNFKNAMKIYENKVRNAFLMKLVSKDRLRKSLQDKKKLNSKQLVQCFLSAFNDDNNIENIIMKWHKKSLYPTLTFKKVCQFNFDKIITNLRDNFTNGVIKFWLKGEIAWKMKIKQKQKQSITSTSSIIQYTFQSFDQQLQQIPKTSIQCLIQTGSTMNFQFQHQQLGVFKSQRFNIIDLLKKRRQSNLQCSIILQQGIQKILILNFQLIFKDHKNFQNSSQKNFIQISSNPIIPKHYPILNQIYLNSFSKQKQLHFLNQHEKQNQLYSISSNIHFHHLKIKYQIQFYSQNQSTILNNFHSAYRLYEKLNIQTLINKFYQSYPFSQYIMVDNKGSFVYNHFVEKSLEKEYYDVQRVIWKQNCLKKHQNKYVFNKRLLNALKCFDQNPRIIFTNNFAIFVNKNLQLANNLTSQKWLYGVFEQSLLGTQAIAFFITLSLLKLASSIFISTPVPRRSLQYDSLLFHFTLKTAIPKIYYKISSTQINVQALFGQQLVSFFTDILPLSLYEFVINLYIEQKNIQKQQNQQFSQTGQHIPNPENYTLIGVFLTILQLTTFYQSAFHNAQTLLIFIKQYFKKLPLKQTLSFRHLLSIKIQLVKQCSNYSNYLQLKKSMVQFYQDSISQDINYQGYGNGINSRDLSEISNQLYNEFICYKYKNQADLRKIFIIIDRLQIPSYNDRSSFIFLPGNQNNIISNNSTYSNFNSINSSHKNKRLILQIYQKNQKIYSHQFQQTDFTKIHHSIQFKLLRLQQLIISFHYQSQHQIYSFKIDPKILPSNYYLQFSQQLQCSVTSIHNKKCYVCYQGYIKDSSQVQFLENRIPEKYINYLIVAGKDLNNSPVLMMNSSASSLNNINNNMSMNSTVNPFNLNNTRLNMTNTLNMMQASININTNVNNNNNINSPRSNQMLKSQSLNNLNLNPNLTNHNINNNIPHIITNIKDDIIFCNNYIRTFRTPQNNFNLIYSKLCWYGNHYLIPQQRLLDITLSASQYSNFNYFSTTNVNLNNYEKQKQIKNQERRKNSFQYHHNSGYQFNSKNKFNNNNRMSSIIQQQIKILYQTIKYTRCVFGKAIIPSPSSQKSSIFGKYLMNQIVCDFQPKQIASNFANIPYNSAQSLETYVLNNFRINYQMSFIQFYIKIGRQLPLIHYLTYQPLEFYILPIIHIEVSYFIKNIQNKCMVFLCGKSKNRIFKFKVFNDFQPSQLHKIQTISNHVDVLKSANNIELQYCQQDISIDQFLILLKMNILFYGDKILKQKWKKQKNEQLKSPKSFIQYRSLKLTTKNIELPNYKIQQVFMCLIQTKQILILQLRQTTSNRNNISQQRMQQKCNHFFDRQINILKYNYENFGHINGKWTKIAILIKFETPTISYFYTQQQETRKKYLLKAQDIIIRNFYNLKNINDHNLSQNIQKSEDQFYPIKKIQTEEDLNNVKQIILECIYKINKKQ